MTTWPGTPNANVYAIGPAEAKRLNLREDTENWITVDFVWDPQPNLKERFFPRDVHLAYARI